MPRLGSRVQIPFPAPSSPARNRIVRRVRRDSRARWQSGDAADCKSVYAGSIPALASIRFVCKSLAAGSFRSRRRCAYTLGTRASCPRRGLEALVPRLFHAREGVSPSSRAGSPRSQVVPCKGGRLALVEGWKPSFPGCSMQGRASRPRRGLEALVPRLVID